MDRKATFDSAITGEQYISLMFQKTDDEGLLYIPGWYSMNEPEHAKMCTVYWDEDDVGNCISAFAKLKELLTGIAVHYNEIDNIADARAVLTDEEFTCWDKYIRPFDIGDIDEDQVRDIGDRMDTVEEVRHLAKHIANNESVDENDLLFMKAHLDTSVSSEEETLYERYVQALYRDAKQRLGKSLCAYEVIIRAMRLCKLLSLNAPKIVVAEEECVLAAAFAVHMYGESVEDVSEFARRQHEELEGLSDEELDERCRPMKKNSGKSMIPLFVYLILKEHTSEARPMRQQDILKRLAREPYEVAIERKALSRTLHGLLDIFPDEIHSGDNGVWFGR